MKCSSYRFNVSSYFEATNKIMPHILKRGIIELFMGTLHELRECFLKF